MVMDQFERQVEGLDVQAGYMDGVMSRTSTLTTPQVWLIKLLLSMRNNVKLFNMVISFVV